VHVVARVHSDGLVHVERAIRHGSHLLNALVGANAIAMLPDGTNPLRGDVLRVIILDADQLVTESST
jgi:molybdopterin biosynthesis enzyme